MASGAGGWEGTDQEGVVWRLSSGPEDGALLTWGQSGGRAASPPPLRPLGKQSSRCSSQPRLGTS